MTSDSNVGFGHHFGHTVDPDTVQALEFNIIRRVLDQGLFQVQFYELFTKIGLDPHHIHPVQVGIPQKAVRLGNQFT